MWNAPEPDPLLAPIAWHVSDALDLVAMRTASDVLLGSHDFRSFCRRPAGSDASEPIVRLVTRARWSLDAGPEASDADGAVPADLSGAAARLLRFDISASSFCHQMVRSLVGTLVDVGRGRKRPSDLVWILQSADRQQASQPAPPHGLTLMAVRYGP